MAEYLNGAVLLENNPSGDGTIVTATIDPTRATIDPAKAAVIGVRVVITEGANDKVYTIVEDFTAGNVPATTFTLGKLFTPVIAADNVKSLEAFVINK